MKIEWSAVTYCLGGGVVASLVAGSWLFVLLGVIAFVVYSVVQYRRSSSRSSSVTINSAASMEEDGPDQSVAPTVDLAAEVPIREVPPVMESVSQAGNGSSGMFIEIGLMLLAVAVSVLVTALIFRSNFSAKVLDVQKQVEAVKADIKKEMKKSEEVAKAKEAKADEKSREFMASVQEVQGDMLQKIQAVTNSVAGLRQQIPTEETIRRIAGETADEKIKVASDKLLNQQEAFEADLRLEFDEFKNKTQKDFRAYVDGEVKRVAPEIILEKMGRTPSEVELRRILDLYQKEGANKQFLLYLGTIKDRGPAPTVPRPLPVAGR